MDESVILTVIGTGVTVIGVIYTFFKDFKESINRNIDGKVNKLDSDIKAIGGRLDTDIKALTEKLDADTKAQTARTDQLYQMFIDLLKAQMPKTNP